MKIIEQILGVEDHDLLGVTRGWRYRLGHPNADSARVADSRGRAPDNNAR